MSDEDLKGMVGHEEAERVVNCTRSALAQLNGILCDIVEKHPDGLIRMRKAFGSMMGELVVFEMDFIRLYPDLEYGRTADPKPSSP